MKRDKVINRALSIFFTILSLAWIYPVFMICLLYTSPSPRDCS